MAISIDDVAGLTEPHPMPTNTPVTSDVTAYTAPELVRRDFIIEGCETKMDYYSLGCVLLEMLTGEPPSNTMRNSGPHLSLFMKKDLKALIRGLLKRNPVERFGFELVTTTQWLYDVS